MCYIVSFMRLDMAHVQHETADLTIQLRLMEWQPPRTIKNTSICIAYTCDVYASLSGMLVNPLGIRTHVAKAGKKESRRNHEKQPLLAPMQAGGCGA